MSERGFSLLEILITSLIFTIFALAITNTMRYCFKNVIESRNAEIAINLCQETIEAIKRFSYETIPCPATFTPTWYKKGNSEYAGYPKGNFPPVLCPATNTDCCIYNGNITDDPAMCTKLEPPHDHKDLLITIGIPGTQTTNGSRTITIKWVDDPNTTNKIHDYKLVTVTVKWNEGGKKRSREMSTYISQK